jgi:hypothetical protein
MAMGAVALTAPVRAQLTISGEDASVKLGILGQFWGDCSSAASG